MDGAAPLVDDKGVITNTIAEGQRLVTRIRILEDGKASNFAPMEQTTTTRAGTGLKQDQKTTSAVLPQARLFAPAVDQIAPAAVVAAAAAPGQSTPPRVALFLQAPTAAPEAPMIVVQPTPGPVILQPTATPVTPPPVAARTPAFPLPTVPAPFTATPFPTATPTPPPTASPTGTPRPTAIVAITAPGSGRIVEAGSALEIRTTISSTFGFATDPNAIVTAVTIGGRSIPIRGLNFEQAGAVLRINAELPRDLAGGPQTLMVCVTDLAGLVGCSSVEIVIRPAPTASPSPTATPTPTPPGKGDPPGKPWRVTAPGSRGCRRPAR